MAVTAHDVGASEVVGVDEEHVLFLVDALEARGVVREQVRAVGRRRVPEKDALDLARVVPHELRVVLHHVRVGGVAHEHELALRIGLEDFVEESPADREGGGDVGEIERPRVKGPERVRLVDVLHVGSRRLLRSRGEVVEVEIVNCRRPVGVDLRHVLPRRVWPCERVKKTLLWIVDLGDAEDIIDIRDNRESGRGD